MTAYDASDVTGARTGMGLVQTHIETICPRYKVATTTGVSQLSPANDTDYTVLSTTITGISTDDLIFASGILDMSSSVAGDRIGAFIKIGTSSALITRSYAPTGSTTGRDQQFASSMVATGLSGSVDVKLIMQRDSGTGDIYSNAAQISIMVFKDGGAA